MASAVRTGGQVPPMGHDCPDAGTGADARASGRRTAPALALLSMGHNSSPVPSKLKVWPEGARADFPGIPDRNPNRKVWACVPGQKPDLKRGLVTEFSAKSRRRLQRTLGTMRVAARAFTMALTLPGGDLADFSHEFVMTAFEKVLRRLSATPRFSGVSGFWKRELQKRGAIHYHLILYGLADDGLRAEFQAWMVKQWVSFFASGMDGKRREHHRWWHARPENMQLVRDFSGYFSKYLGKDGEAGKLSGRWWGSFNKQGLPVAARSEASVSVQVAVRLHRLARKARRKKMDASKARGDAARIAKAFAKGYQIYGTDDLWRLRSGYMVDSHVGCFRNARLAAFYLKCYRHGVKVWAGVSVGPCRYRGKVPKTAPIVLCGDWVSGFAACAVAWVSRSLGIGLDLKEAANPQDFTPDPLKPVPPGRTPRNLERHRFQGDFLGELRVAENRWVPSVPTDDDFPRSVRRRSFVKNVDAGRKLER